MTGRIRIRPALWASSGLRSGFLVCEMPRGLSHWTRSEHPHLGFAPVTFSGCFREMGEKGPWAPVSSQEAGGLVEMGEGPSLSRLPLIGREVEVNRMGTCNHGVLGAARQAWSLVFAVSSPSSTLSGLWPSPREARRRTPQPMTFQTSCPW